MLHYAARAGCKLEIFEYLIEKGADPKVLDDYDTNVLMVYLRCPVKPQIKEASYLAQFVNLR